MDNANFHFELAFETNKTYIFFGLISCEIPLIRYSFWRMSASKRLDGIGVKFQRRLQHFKRSLNMVTWSSSVSELRWRAEKGGIQIQY